jgi:hypothetical protein
MQHLFLYQGRSFTESELRDICASVLRGKNLSLILSQAFCFMLQAMCSQGRLGLFAAITSTYFRNSEIYLI